MTGNLINVNVTDFFPKRQMRQIGNGPDTLQRAVFHWNASCVPLHVADGLLARLTLCSFKQHMLANASVRHETQPAFLYRTSPIGGDPGKASQAIRISETLEQRL